MSIPIDEQVNFFLEFTGSASRDVALSFIKGNGGDVQNAVNEYFNDSNPRRYDNNVSWDDTAFTGDREGVSSNTNAGALVPYNDLASGGLGPAYGPQVAPSRPPSRSDHNREAAPAWSEYYKDSVPSWASSGRTEFEGEHEAMQRSMRELPSGQETGVINARGHEYVPDPPARERTRRAGEPAFLKPLPNHDFLPALVTILQAIPQVRALLAFPTQTSTDYGQDAHWWEGETIAVPRVKDLSAVQDAVLNAEDVIQETQRLMAFLDGTTRSYGSVASLARWLGQDATYTAPWSDGPQFGEALSTWDNLLQRDNRVALFTSELLNSASSDTSSSEKSLVHFDADVVYGLEGEEATLYASLNQALWGDSLKPSAVRDGWLARAAPIAVMRVQQPWQTHGAPNKLVVPEIFFADRYMADNSEYMKEVGQQMTVYQDAVRAANDKLAKLETFVSAHNRTGSASAEVTDAGKLMATVIGFLKERVGDSQRVPNTNGFVQLGRETTVHSDPLVGQLESIYARIDKRIQALQEEKEAARAALRALSTTLTGSTGHLSSEPRMAYMLCGVGTIRLNQPAVTYIPAQTNAEGLERKQNPMWWKMCYETTGSTARVIKYMVPRALVLEAAGSCTADTLLVYASRSLLESDVAISESQEALKAFVMRDNELFAEEVSKQEAPRNQMSDLPPDSHFGQGLGRRLSNDSTTVLGGDSPRDGSVGYDMMHPDTHLDRDEPMMDAAEEMQTFSRPVPRAEATTGDRGADESSRQMQEPAAGRAGALSPALEDGEDVRMMAD